MACQSMHLDLSLTNNQVQKIDANGGVAMEHLGRPGGDQAPRAKEKGKPWSICSVVRVPERLRGN